MLMGSSAGASLLNSVGASQVLDSNWAHAAVDEANVGNCVTALHPCGGYGNPCVGRLYNGVRGGVWGGSWEVKS